METGHRPSLQKDYSEESETDMARAAAKIVDQAKVAALAKILEDADIDRTAFDTAVAILTADKSLRSQELIAIAKTYAGLARRITSKKSALDAIHGRFVDKVRFEKKNAHAASSRPW